MNTENKCGALNKVRLTGNILFSGIGAQERGFEDSGLFEIEVLTTSDICKEAVLSYAAIHCGLTCKMVENYPDYPTREEMAQHLTNINLGYEPDKNKYYDWFKLIKKKNKELEKYWLACKLSNNLGDISKIEELPYADFWTVSFCCQDISVAGKMKGLKPDSGTRSSLLWDNIKLLERAKNNSTLPKYIMFENVKNLVSKKFINDFNDLIDVLGELGFNTYWKVINGKDCGIPQNRERVFVIAIRKDIDTEKFEFPTPFDNGLRLRDILDTVVDERFYLSDEKVKDMISNMSPCCKNKNSVIRIGKINSSQDGLVVDINGLSPTHTSGHGNSPKIITVGNVNPSGNGMNGNVFSDNGLAPTLTTNKGEGNKILINKESNELQQVGSINNYNDDANRVYSDNLARTLKSEAGGGGAKTGWCQTSVECNHTEFPCIYDDRDKGFGVKTSDYCPTQRAERFGIKCIEVTKRVRKLIPKECWRLMGFRDSDCEAASNIGVADSHLYKEAGNSIITNCVRLLAEHLYKAQYDNTYKCTDENFTQPQVD
ncbi:DNA (cytosine-5)-methyltransferase 1 [Lacrimispora sphenoides]|uniref:DNA cytosine methyltransferase n=1 Tax=Lacrimispora sphenoides TaxID=29370 RepID=UPI0008D0D299|nr:DNA (cytosine-5-)-methyltransferase [Lacrimispora sphenoides]SEU09553.1 DNA (cytosine-5)-methyltransferase 1 [Lacrimispora sphenoides]